MLDGSLELVSDRHNKTEVEDLLANWNGQETSSTKQFEAQNIDRVEAIAAPPLAVRGSARCAGGDLETMSEVEGQQTEQLPGAVGGIAQRRDSIEGEARLEFA